MNLESVFNDLILELDFKTIGMEIRKGKDKYSDFTRRLGRILLENYVKEKYPTNYSSLGKEKEWEIEAVKDGQVYDLRIKNSYFEVKCNFSEHTIENLPIKDFVIFEKLDDVPEMWKNKIKKQYMEAELKPKVLIITLNRSTLLESDMFKTINRILVLGTTIRRDLQYNLRITKFEKEVNEFEIRGREYVKTLPGYKMAINGETEYGFKTYNEYIMELMDPDLTREMELHQNKMFMPTSKIADRLNFPEPNISDPFSKEKNKERHGIYGRTNYLMWMPYQRKSRCVTLEDLQKSDLVNNKKLKLLYDILKVEKTNEDLMKDIKDIHKDLAILSDKSLTKKIIADKNKSII